MAEDVLEDAGSAPDAGRAKREPPTIDLDATKVSETGPAGMSEAETTEAHTSEAAASASSSSSFSPSPRSPSTSPWVIAPFSGAAAAALVILVGWLLGWPAVQSAPVAPPINNAAIDALGTRVSGLESKVAKPPVPATDAAVTARLTDLEKSQASLRDDLATLRAQSDKLAANESKPAPSGDSASAAPPPVDLSAINARLDQLDRTSRAQAAAIAQAGAKAAATLAADDLPLRRVVAAALLDVAVRHGDPYEGALTAAKALAPDPDKLKPLDRFADKGVPSPPILNRELLVLVPKLTPVAANEPSGTGIVDRLEDGASKLIRVERTDAVGNDRNAVVARATSAALRNDFTEARRELSLLSPADRAPAQAWLDKAAARDAALEASRQFAEETMAALAKPAQ